MFRNTNTGIITYTQNELKKAKFRCMELTSVCAPAEGECSCSLYTQAKRDKDYYTQEIEKAAYAFGGHDRLNPEWVTTTQQIISFAHDIVIALAK